ncbi:abortive infection protein [Gracilibacillus boraciitolerans JCM 21714]|uniref:Abortive infection protein n=1 Tax=Gracilibacillus boraciitolerans JCM 21714 TaxID=1298598 RepID=W4VPC1_9BACI|nr:AAA family ATPase [Gracilibacillus boraciitolerans]GAE94594.1 abortive infection protein [Gracilibacillus boraciitolerans JCM 21714]
MLIEFGVENLLSYKDRQIFKMDSDFRRAKIFNDNVLYKIPVDKKNRYVLNTAAVYGSNAGGKTNLIASMRYLHEIVKSSNDLNSIAPFQFTNERKPISFHIKFLKRYNEDNYLFKYVLDIFDGKVLKEQLSYQLVRKTTLSDIQIIFKRENDQIHEYAPGLEELVKDMNKHNNETRAILTVLYQDINKTHYQNIVDTLAYQLLKVAYEFISYDLAFGRESVDESYLVKKLQEYPELKEKLIDALYDIDITISDLEFEDVTDLLIDDIMNDTQLPKDLKKRFIETRKSNRVYNIKTIRELEDSNFDLEFGSESLGTIKFIFDFIQLMDCIENNRVI